MQNKVFTFDGLRPASELASRTKRNNRSRDTLQELALGRELRSLGLNFHKNVETLPGRPDIVFPQARVVVFCDGDFWHGRRWPVLGRKLRKGTNAGYWFAKIASNIRRDRRTTALLKNSGWCVLRFWETDIKKNPAALAAYVKKSVAARQARRS